VIESEERFRSLAEVSPDSITVFVDGRYVYGNPNALRLLGLSSLEEMKAVDPWASVPEARRAAVTDHVARLARGERPPPMVHRHARPDGQEVILEASVALASMGGKPAIVSYTRDISERMRLQAELMKQDRLASVGLLAAGVAHELNNPLTTIALQVRTLRAGADEHGLSPAVRQVLEQLDEAASRMRSIIGDLLFMARPATQPQAHVDVGQILTSTIALLCAGTSPTPRVECDIGALPPIQAYASKLGQVFLNVLRNAVQALDGVAEGLIRVSARERDGAIEVTVTDNGAGIPESVQPRLMQPFFTTKPDGTGLGLWISHTLLAEHGGALHVSSVEGQGTTVTMRVPSGKA
jgi:PAS domain S-box-containing protein